MQTAEQKRAQRRESYQRALTWLREGKAPDEVAARLRKSGLAEKAAGRATQRADDALQRELNPGDRSADERQRYCAECGASLTSDASFCDGCGAHVPDAEDAHFRRTQIDPHLKKAQQWIGAVAIVCALGAIAMGILFENFAIFAVNMVLAGIQVGLWLWAKRNLLAAAVTSLVLFVTVHLVSAIADPSSLLQGIIVKVLFIAILIRAIQAALQARSFAGGGALA